MKYLIVLIFLLSIIKIEAQDTFDNGKDFWFAFLDNRSASVTDNLAPITYKVSLSARETTTGTIAIPQINWNYNFIIPANESIEIELPANIVENTQFNSIQKKGIHITASHSIYANMLNRRTFTGDASQILPIENIGNSYILNMYSYLAPVTNTPSGGHSEFVIVATEDNTLVQITPKVNLLNHAINIPYTVLLNKGESYQNQSTSLSQHVSGTEIKVLNSTCKKIAVFSGSQSTEAISACDAADHIFDQEIPLNQWGTTYFLAPFKYSSVYSAQIVASQNNTVVTINNTTINLNKGQAYLINPYDWNTFSTHKITSNYPISVTQYMRGSSCAGFGDPSVVNLTPQTTGIKDVHFQTFSSPGIDTNYISIITETSYINEIILDGESINSSLFINYTFDAGYSYAVIPVSKGNHNLTSNHLCKIMLFGYGFQTYESYAISLDHSNLYVNNNQNQTTICANNNIQLAAPTNVQSPWWSTVNNSTDTLYNGNNLQLNYPFESNLYILNGFDSIANCESKLYYNVSSNVAPLYELHVPNDTICKNENPNISIDFLTESDYYNVEWLPSNDFSNDSLFSTQLISTESKWYYVRITPKNYTNTPCFYVLDSFFVHQLNSEIISQGIEISNKYLCGIDSTTLSVEIQKSIFHDDFNSGSANSNWSSLISTTISTACNSTSNALVFNGSTPIRIATFGTFDLSTGGTIKVTVDCGGTCNKPELSDKLILQYSVNNGTTWQTLYNFVPNSFQLISKQLFSIPIPVLSTNTLLRFSQSSFEGASFDIWIVDDVEIYQNQSNYPITWSPSQLVENNTSLSTIAHLTNNTWFYANYSSLGCVYQDSIFVIRDTFNIDLTSSPISCTSNSVNINAISNTNSNFESVWNFNGTEIPITNTVTIPFNIIQQDLEISVSSVSSSGCSQKDTLIYQIPESYFEVAFSGDSIICFGDTLNFSGFSRKSYFDNFNESAINMQFWDSIVGGKLSTACNVISGNSLHFDSSTVRLAQTREFNFSHGGQVSFDISYGNGINGSGCGMTSGTEFSHFQYSTDNGQTWQVKAYLTFTTGSSTFTHYDIDFLPIQTPVILRWIQPSHTNAYNDTWNLENIRVTASKDSTQIVWTDAQNQVLSTNNIISFVPSNSQYLYATITDTVSQCSITDSIQIKLGTPFTLQIPDTTICNYSTVNFIYTPNLPSGNDYTFNWHQNTNTYHDSTLQITLTTSSQITTEIISTNGCSMKDTFFINLNQTGFSDVKIVGDNGICLNDTSTIKAYPIIQKITYNFDNLTTSAYTGGVINNTYGSTSGNALVFNGVNPRKFEGNNLGFNILQGGLVEFDLKFCDNNTCDGPEINEYILVQYSINYGSNWTTFDTIFVNHDSYFSTYRFNLPLIACTANTNFRLLQSTASGSNLDIWILDNFSMYRLSNSATTYQWLMNNQVFSNLSQIDVSPTSTVNYTMLLSTIDNQCHVLDTFEVKVSNFNVNAGLDYSYCENEQYQLQGNTNAISPFEVHWNNPLSLNNSTILNPTILHPEDQTYELMVIKNGCIKLDSVYLHVNAIDSIIDSVSICSGSNYTFQDGYLATNITAPLSHTCTFTNQNGCDSMIITHLAIYNVSSTVDSINICSGSNYTFQDGYLATNITAPFSHTCTFTNQNGCDSMIITHLLPQNINSSISVMNDTLFAQEGMDIYQWLDCDLNSEIIGAQNPIFIPSYNGTFAVIIQNESCVDTSVCETISDLKVEKIMSNLKIHICPNPSEGIFNITLGNNKWDEYSVRVLDLVGQEIYVKEYYLINSFTLDFLEQPEGIYYLEIGNKTNFIREKILLIK
ncbi:MAG: T9SS type A sorting domain-containing protein [Flavobacteriia bacterium]|nr:T9SS type A sorting domain-containing protein [Flavobacteriia bacterium]